MVKEIGLGKKINFFRFPKNIASKCQRNTALMFPKRFKRNIAKMFQNKIAIKFQSKCRKRFPEKFAKMLQENTAKKFHSKLRRRYNIPDSMPMPISDI